MEEYQDRSLGGKVFQQIRADIINGRYRENDELRENTIGKELGVSRTPVREALRQLELEGLVTIIPNRGAYVTGISHKDIRDIYMIRSLLEDCARGGQQRTLQKRSWANWKKSLFCQSFRSTVRMAAVRIRSQLWTADSMRLFMKLRAAGSLPVC